MKIISSMEWDVRHLQMEIGTLGSGSMTRSMAKVNTSMQTESTTKEIGKTIKRMASAGLNGQMGPGTRETTCMAISTGQESWSTKMGLFMKVNFTSINCKVTAVSNQLTPRHTLVNG